MQAEKACISIQNLYCDRPKEERLGCVAIQHSQPRIRPGGLQQARRHSAGAHGARRRSHRRWGTQGARGRRTLGRRAAGGLAAGGRSLQAGSTGARRARGTAGWAA